MTSFARSERAALCDLMLTVGPAAPTLCEGWDAADLAAHLRLRETSPLAVGIVLPGADRLLERAQRQVADGDFQRLVEQVRRPPRWSPMSWDAIDRRANTAEFFVHHEDVRRAQPGWQPRELAPGQERALWALLQSQGRALFRKAPVGVVLERPDGTRFVARSGEPAVTLRGPVSELVLFAFGRTEHALVTLDGDEDALEQFAGTSLGI
jgi:uncharacterized protein (TIGR03085 family)